MAIWAFILVILLSSFWFCVKASDFDKLFRPSWANDHLITEGQGRGGIVKLTLDHSSGVGFVSKNKYLFGKATAEIKLVPGDSAGTVTAYYMSSEGPNHHEFDFEFLGNTTGNPYSVQTNVYINGVGNREQRMDLWFDPTWDFHSYSILWNQKHVVFLVDDTPIRVHRNKESEGIPFPNDQPMAVYSSIWNADDWATQGGRVKTDWTHAPFVTTFRHFQLDGCVVTKTEEMAGKCKTDNNTDTGSNGSNKNQGRPSADMWWKEPTMEELSVHQTHQLKWVRANHLIYDYCTDQNRFPVLPPDCMR
ncbi:xyloglucan endotransglucosylase/hydrolase, family GH16 [Zostera marina]|uniref:Xyloglucan endotransglucosylase/hydrolase n=1 Tax=Zostera marina TaxID=29655 RepID=A0A0K9NY91_ZOSMR|nr:xyloglucan endotransglucosylase/hydrolase, family GH16 [Zostera marina]